MNIDYAKFFNTSIYIFGGFSGIVSSVAALVYGTLLLIPNELSSETNAELGITLIVLSVTCVIPFVGGVVGATIGIIIACFICTIIIVTGAIRDTIKLIYYKASRHPVSLKEQFNDKYKEIVV